MGAQSDQPPLSSPDDGKSWARAGEPVSGGVLICFPGALVALSPTDELVISSAVSSQRSSPRTGVGLQTEARRLGTALQGARRLCGKGPTRQRGGAGAAPSGDLSWCSM